MSESPKIFLGQPDALSSLISGLALSAEIYVDGDFCGAWALDTSGSRKMAFHMIGRGEAWLHTEGASPKRLGPGDLVVFPRDDSHILSNSSTPPDAETINVPPTWSPDLPATNVICGYFEFENPIVWPLLDALDATVLLDMTDCSTAPYTRTYIDLILGELNKRNPGFHTVVNQLAYLLFVEVLRQQIAAGKVKTGLLFALFDPKISRALEAIHNNPGLAWSLESLARHAAMGRSSFAKKFHELVGIPAMQYLTTWRMQLARQLLATTSLATAEIAENCGYESEAAFRKAFKKNLGINPGAVRKGKEP